MRFSHLTLAAGTALLAACGDSGPSNVPPAAAFVARCARLECTLTGGGTDADGSIAAYDWDFDDESAHATTREAAHTYAQPGEFTVTLTVTDDDGDTAVATEQLTVSNSGAPTASFTMTCDELTCTFTDRSFDPDAGGRIASYDWDFGDNKAHAASRDPVHTYTSPGEFTVTLTVTDDDGATAKTTSSANPNAAPAASFTFSCTDLTCAFTDRSVDQGGAVTGYIWRFHDVLEQEMGSGYETPTSLEKNPQHTFSQNGIYAVSLTVTDARGATGSVTSSIHVPAPEFTVSCVARQCTFTLTQNPTGGAPEWHFGDGQTSSDVNPTHVYAVNSPTAFTVTLWSMFDWFEGVSNSRDITVSP
jgi:large repetitive protein